MKMDYKNVKNISTKEFLLRPVSDYNEPLIIKDFYDGWPAKHRWSFDFFSEKYGDLPVKVYDDNFSRQGKFYLKCTYEMPFREYLQRVQHGQGHLRLFLFELLKLAPELKRDVQIPASFNALSHLNLFMFFGGVGATPPTHYDVDLPHVFHSVFAGEKTVYLFAPQEAYHLHKHPFTVRSYVDPQQPDYVRFPRFKDATGWLCTVSKGDTLLIPNGFWHRIYYNSPGFSISLRLYERERVLRGLYNLLINEKIDVLCNAIAPDAWFNWKSRRAGEVMP